MLDIVSADASSRMFHIITVRLDFLLITLIISDGFIIFHYFNIIGLNNFSHH